MPIQRSWFQSGVDPGTIITLDQPLRAQWEIVEKLNEHGKQMGQAEHDHRKSGHSMASVKLLCWDPNDHGKTAYMRIYQQLAFLNTEFLDADARAKQAAKYTPPELTAYQHLTQHGSTNTPKLLGYKITIQDKSGPVPNGFLVYLAWEVVPGLRLGNKHGPDPYWTLDSSERHAIRASFVKELLALMQNEYANDKTGLSSLVWHKASNTLYFLGFRECNIVSFKGPLDELKWMKMYGLTIPPPGEAQGSCWDVDTSG